MTKYERFVDNLEVGDEVALDDGNYEVFGIERGGMEFLLREVLSTDGEWWEDEDEEDDGLDHRYGAERRLYKAEVVRHLDKVCNFNPWD